MKRIYQPILHGGLAILISVVFVLAQAVNPPMARAQTSATTAAPVDVNSASAKTLETLPGITPTLAKRIIAGRPYQSMTDLGKVQGLSKTKLNGIKDSVTFGPASTTTAKKSTKKTATNSTETASVPPPAATSTSGKKTSSSTSGTTQTTPTPTGHASGKLAPGQTININSASAEELEALPGIGPTKAQAIVDYRNQHGNFNSIEDIENVKGIKSGEFSKIKDYIKVSR